MGLMACGGGDEVAATAKKGDAFCKLAEKADEAGDEIDTLDPFSADADELEDAFTDALAAAEKATAKAPKDISEDLNELLDLQKEIVGILEDNDFDFAKALEDEELLKLGEDVEGLNEDLEEYLDDKCGIEPDDDSADEGSGGEDSGDEGSEGSLPGGLVTAENFLDFYAIGAGVEITQEMRDCFAEKTSDLSQEDFDAAMNGSPSDEISTAIGLAILGCDIPVSG
jgi:hypothetical protein